MHNYDLKSCFCPNIAFKLYLNFNKKITWYFSFFILHNHAFPKFWPWPRFFWVFLFDIAMGNHSFYLIWHVIIVSTFHGAEHFLCFLSMTQKNIGSHGQTAYNQSSDTPTQIASIRDFVNQTSETSSRQRQFFLYQ